MESDETNPNESEIASSPAVMPANILQDLDRRQNEVIARLDVLNDRIDKVIQEWTRRTTEDSDVHDQAA